MEGIVLVALDSPGDARRVAELVYEVLQDPDLRDGVRVWVSDGLYDVVVEVPKASHRLLAVLASAIRRRVPSVLSVDWVLKTTLIRGSPGLPGDSYARP